MRNRLSRFEYFDTAAGKTDVAWQLSAFRRFAGNAVESALQLGVPSIDALSQTQAGLKILSCDRAPLKRNQEASLILCEDASLALETESIDLVLWPHGFDRYPDTKEVLSEISRVLVPEGALVVTFFNRHGPWSLRRKLPIAHPLLPEDISLHTVSSARAQLLHAGLTFEAGAYGVYGIDAKEGAQGKTLLEKAGDRWWPMLGNLVILVARKHRQGMRLVGKAQFNSPSLGTLGAATAGNTTQKEGL